MVDRKEKNNMQDLYRIMQIFNIQDYSKELLFNSETERQERRARSLLERTNTELKMLYIPTPIENVQQIRIQINPSYCYYTAKWQKGQEMSKLYELKENYKQIASMLYEEEIDEQCILDTLESIEGEIDEKADNYAVIIKELLGDAEICKQEKLRLEARQKSFENRAKLLKDKLQEVMIETGKTKFKTAKFSFGIQKNGGLAPLWVDEDYSNIPQKYLKVEPDNTKIRQALDTGENIMFAHYEERGESLRIKQIK